MALAVLALKPFPWTFFQVATNFGMAVAASVLTVFHLRHTALNGLPWATAARILAVTTLLTMLGVDLAIRSIGIQGTVGLGFLLTTPLIAQAMLNSALIGPAVALFGLTVSSFFLGFSGLMSLEMLAVSWITGAVAVHAVNPLKRRADLLRATSVQVAAMVVMAALVSANQVDTVSMVLESAVWAAVAAVAATSIFWLMVAVFEKMFGLISDWSLLEMCSPDHPLIRDLCMRAPGTYAHSVMVASLAENAAREIGANSVQCRAMAYFHDVGKIKLSGYFIENQFGENLHDRLSPSLSAQIIAGHVKKGVELAREHRLPQIIVDGIEQHHGTTLISYFYHRAQTQGGGADDPEFEKLFRYPGPKPRTRETAILHIADQVEAASRTVPRDQIEELELLVARIIENSRAEGQFDECDLTFRDLTLIHQSLMRSLGALRHERIVYPEETANAASEPNPHPDHPQLPESGAPRTDPPRNP